MEEGTIKELETCVYLCTKMESVLQQDIDELQACLKGDVYVQYLNETQESLEMVTSLKRHINGLLSQYTALL